MFTSMYIPSRVWSVTIGGVRFGNLALTQLVTTNNYGATANSLDHIFESSQRTVSSTILL
jgi:hypothetical protein